MIPKIIHYCWFGNKPMSKLMTKCIKSWKKFCPDYEFKLWNEETFNIGDACDFVRDAYQNKQYAHVSDYVRMYALYTYGGIYLDTDIEIVKRFDDRIHNRATVILGTDEGGNLTALMASEPGSDYIKRLMKEYESTSFINPDSSLNLNVNNYYMEKILKHYGYKVENEAQDLGEVLVYPDDWFHARSLTSGKLNITGNTYTIHWHASSWVPLKTSIIKFLRIKIIVPLIGARNYTTISTYFKNGKRSV